MKTRVLTLPALWFCVACAPSAPPQGPSSEARATTAESEPTSAPSSVPGALMFRAMVSEGAVERSFAEGAELHTGDRVAFHLELQQPTHLYLLQYFADGSSAVLFPDDGQAPSVPAGVVRVPSSGWYELDEAVGEEHVYLVATARPLESAAADVHALVKDVRVSSSSATAESESGPAQQGDTEERPAAAGAGATRPPEGAAPPAPASEHASKQLTPGTGHPVSEGESPAATSHTGRSTASVAKPSRPRPPPLRLATRGLKRVHAPTGEGPTLEITPDGQGVAIVHFAFKHVGR